MVDPIYANQCQDIREAAYKDAKEMANKLAEEVSKIMSGSLG